MNFLQQQKRLKGDRKRMIRKSKSPKLHMDPRRTKKIIIKRPNKSMSQNPHNVDLNKYKKPAQR